MKGWQLMLCHVVSPKTHTHKKKIYSELYLKGILIARKYLTLRGSWAAQISIPKSCTPNLPTSDRKRFQMVLIFH